MSTTTRYCDECANEGRLRAVAIYSRTQCGAHWQRSYQAILDAATPEEIARCAAS